MQYFGIGFESFIENLRKAMNNRIDSFERNMLAKSNRYSGIDLTKSKRQWMIEFKKWSKQEDDLKETILKYMKEGE